MNNTHNTVLYAGVTNDLARRVYEHKQGLGTVFVRRCNITKQVSYEIGDNVQNAILREKKIKGGSRRSKST